MKKHSHQQPISSEGGSNCGFHFETSYTLLPKGFFTEQSPSTVPAPSVVVVNHRLAETIGLNFFGLTEQEQAKLFSGNRLPHGATPFAQAYAGHQFGHFTVLGDGRAHLWGEHVAPDGKKWDIQFKGSGRTPYSRRGDGKAALGPMLREYMISEAMHALGIPTTRSLAVVTTGESILRDTPLPGAILTRIASSHIRVGTFQFAAAQRDKYPVEALMDYAIQRHYPELATRDNKALAFLKAIAVKQIELIVDWMRVGFIHGVMNTDNMTVSGETIDYGPCAFMDAYDPNTVFSSIDHSGRYAYANQPGIARWNLARLAETLLPWIDENEHQAVILAEAVLQEFSELYQQKWLTMMCSKLGVLNPCPDDGDLISELLHWMQNNHADYTNTFRDLNPTTEPIGNLYAQHTFQSWYRRWQKRLEKNTQSLESALCLMKNTNPAVIPRNHQVEKALAASYKGDFEPFQNLLTALRSPYEDLEISESYKNPPQESEFVYQTFCGT